MSSEGLPGPSFELKGSPIIPADMDAFLGAYGVKSLDANVPVAADAAMQWIHDKFDSANQESGVETVRLLSRLAKGFKQLVDCALSMLVCTESHCCPRDI